MTDDPETVAKGAIADTPTDEPTAEAETASKNDLPAPDTAEPTARDSETTTAEEDGDASPVAAGDRAGDETTVPRRRSTPQFVGTLLIAVGLAIIGLTVGITAWRQHQHDAETRAFLTRVSTPGASSGTLATTPFPSTISGALVPDTARTPTANVATRGAQPVATTTGGVDRSIIAATPVPAATPAAAANGSAVLAPTPKPQMPKPTHIGIPAIKVDSDIVEVGVSPIIVDGQQAYIWDVAPYAVGHHFSSADPGEGENVVLSGHDDWQGEVFKNLYKLKQGDEIMLQAGDRQIKYHVDEILLLPEVGQPLDKRIENAKFIGTTGDERLTLITCWPYAVDDHRLVVIARPDVA